MVLLILAWAGMELQSEFARADRQRNELDRSHASRAQIQQVFSLLQDAETGQRGYIITGQPRFLEPYEASQRQLTNQLIVLDRLFVNEPDQKAPRIRPFAAEGP